MTPFPPSRDSELKPEEQNIQINGFKQVIEMLQVADPVFRESLLKRLAQKDLKLAHSLRSHLRK